VEERSLLLFEGGSKKESKKTSKKTSKKSKEKEPEEEKPPRDLYHCCCTYPCAILVYGILLAIFGFLIIANIFVEFNNKYYPLWYPFISFMLALVFVAGIVLFFVWCCKESQETRTSLKIGGWLILGSILSLVFWNILFILNYKKTRDGTQGVEVGSGDDDEDYDKETRGEYVLGYLLWGTIMVCLDIVLLVLAFQYDDSFPEPKDEEDEEEDADDEKKMDDKMEEMMMEDAGEGMEGGALETMRSGKRSRAASRSSSMVRRRNALNMSHMSNVSAKSGMSKKSIKSVRSVALNKSVKNNKMNVAAPPVLAKDFGSERGEKAPALIAD